MKRKVVVTGVGAVTPVGMDWEESWRGLCQGQSGVDEIRSFDASTFPVQIAGEVNGFHPPEILEEKGLLEYTNRCQQLLLASVEMAMSDAELDLDALSPARLGVSVGASAEFPSTDMLAYSFQFMEDGEWNKGKLGAEWVVSPKSFYRTAVHNASCMLSTIYGFRGPNITVHTACSSSSQAIGEAFRMVQRGEADIVITGGADTLVSPLGVAGFSLLGVLSRKRSTPQMASRPFDRKRDGFVLGEGAGILILEEEQHARERGVGVHGEIGGYGCTSNAFRITDISPDGEGAARAMEAALADGNMTPTNVDYINAHGTSTVQNDKIETIAIKRVFGEYAYKIPDQFDQVHDGTHHIRFRSPRVNCDSLDDPRRNHPTDHQL